MKNNLNILEAYLDKVLLEAGGVHQKWFSGADEAGIEALRAVAQSTNAQLTKQGAQAEAGKMGPWGGAQMSSPEFDPKTGQVKSPGTVYWMSNAPEVNSGSADKVLAAIAQWKPKESPSKADMVDQEQGVADGTIPTAEEQQAQAEEEARLQEERQTDRQTDEEQLKTMTDQLGERLGINSVEAEKMVRKLDANCKKPTDHKYAADFRALLAYTRTDELKFGLPGEANKEMFDAYADMLDATQHIKKDSEGEYILAKDLTARQRDLFTSCRARGQSGQNGVYVGYDGGRADVVFPHISKALTDIMAARVGNVSDAAGEAANDVDASFFKYGLSVAGSEPVGEALARVQLRDELGSQEPLLALTSASKGTASNKAIGEFSEKSWIGILNFMTTGEDDGSMAESIQDFAKQCQLMDKIAQSNPDKLKKQLPDIPYTAQEEEELKWYQRANDFYNTHGAPNELVKQVFMQNAMNLSRLLKHAKVAPVKSWSPTKDEERGHDLQFGVKRDIVFEFATDKDAAKFCKNLGLGPEYAHGKEVDLSLKQLTQTTGKINNEGATLSVALGESTSKAKQEQFEKHKESTYERIKQLAPANGRGEKYIEGMDKARDWDTKTWSSLYAALHPKQGKMQGSMETLFNSILDKNCPGTPEGIKKREAFMQVYQDYKEALPGATNVPKEGWTLAKNLFGALKQQRADTNRQYKDGSMLNDVMGCLSTSHSEVLVRMHQDKVSAFGTDGILGAAIDAAQNGNIVTKPNGGFYIMDDEGNRIADTSLVVAVNSKGEPFIRLRGGIEGKHFNDNSEHVPS